MSYKSTKEVAAILRVKPSRLTRALWEGRVSSPDKGPGGAFLWTKDDIRHACWVLLGRDLDDVLKGQEGCHVG